MSAANTQRKAVIGEDHTFVWRAPGPLTTTPLLTLTKPDGTDIVDTPLPLTNPAALSAIANDRRTLTIGSSTPTNACTGPDFGAIAVIGQDGGFAIAQVERFNSDTEIVLSRPLPHPIDVGLGATVQWLTYAATIASADLGASPLRNIAWRMTYDRRFNGLGVELETASRGVLQLVRVPFNTGLTDADLAALVPSVVVPGRQDSMSPQIDAALELLEQAIAVRLDADVYPDQLSGRQFRVAHAYMAAHLVENGRRLAPGTEPRTDLRAEAERLIAEALARPEWIDIDDDGVVDANEVDDAQPSQTLVTGTFTSAFEASHIYIDIDEGR